MAKLIDRLTSDKYMGKQKKKKKVSTVYQFLIMVSSLSFLFFLLRIRKAEFADFVPVDVSIVYDAVGSGRSASAAIAMASEESPGKRGGGKEY